MRDLAARLIAYEVAHEATALSSSVKPQASSATPGSAAPSHATVFVCEKLRPPLASLMGSTGVRALFLRALARASAEVPSLHVVRANKDGALEGLIEFESNVTAHEFVEGRLVLLAQLLELLVAFIGENLTRRLVSDVWPEVSLDDLRIGRTD